MSIQSTSPLVRLTSPLIPWINESPKRALITQIFFAVLGCASGVAGLVLFPKGLVLLSISALSFISLSALLIADVAASVEQNYSRLMRQ